VSTGDPLDGHAERLVVAVRDERLVSGAGRDKPCLVRVDDRLDPVAQPEFAEQV
jgi:hypothetical protein